MASAPVVTQVVQWAQNPYSSPWLAVSYTNNGPYNQGISVERQAGDGTGSITVIAGWSSDDGSTNWWLDNTCAVDGYYQYRVKGTHNGTTYTSAWKKGHTVPASPAPLVAVRSAGKVVLSWTNKSTTGQIAYNVYKSGVLLATTAANASTYTDNASGDTAALSYTVFPIILAGLNLVARSGNGGWVPLSASLPVPGKASPPTLTPSATALNLATTALVVGVQHNPTDYSAQTSGNVRYRQVGGSTWTTVALGTATSITVSAGTLGNGIDYEFQGQTAGMAGGLSDWSTSVIVSGSTNPTAAITTPANGASVNTGTVTIGWSYTATDGRPQAGWEVKLLVGGTQVDGASGTGAVLSWVSGQLSNSTAYTINVRVMNSVGLWSTVASRTFNASFPAPPAPTVVPSWNPDTGTVALVVTNPTPGGGQDAAVANRVYRDGVLVADGLAVNVTYSDPVPALNSVPTYRVEAVTVAGSIASTTIPVSTALGDRRWVFLNGGDGYTLLGRMREQVAITASPDRDKSLVLFEGRTLPVEYAGQGITRPFRVSGEVRGMGTDTDLIGTWEPFAQLAELPAPLVFRDPLGRRVVCSTSAWSIVHDSQGPEASVGFTVTEVDQT